MVSALHNAASELTFARNSSSMRSSIASTSCTGEQGSAPPAARSSAPEVMSGNCARPPQPLSAHRRSSSSYARFRLVNFQIRHRTRDAQSGSRRIIAFRKSTRLSEPTASRPIVPCRRVPGPSASAGSVNSFTVSPFTLTVTLSPSTLM